MDYRQRKKLLKKIIDEFGAGEEISIPMREYDDVPNFIRKMDRAHRLAAKSTLRFGPPLRKEKS